MEFASPDEARARFEERDWAGGRLDAVPATLVAAVEAVAAAHDERTAARLERFAAVPDGSFVWTRDGDGS